MNQKIPALITIGIISVLIFSGCIGEKDDDSPPVETTLPTGPTADEIIGKSIEAMGNVHSYAFDMDIKISAPEQSGKGDMNIIGAGKVDMSNERMYNKVDMGMLGMTVSIETYVIDGMQYIMVPTTGWVKNETTDDVWEQDFVKSQMGMMKDIGVNLLGSEKISGIDHHILEMRPDPVDILKLMGQQMGGVPDMSPEEVSEMIKSLELKEWIAKDTFLVTRSVTDMRMENNGEIMDLEMTMDLSDYNQPMNIELPDEAKDAKDLDDLMESRMVGYESPTT